MDASTLSPGLASRRSPQGLVGPETWDRGGGAGLAFLATCSTGAGTRVPCLRGGAQDNMDKNDDNPCPNEHHITLQARLLPQTAMSWGLCPRFIQEETEALRGKCSIPASLPHVLNGPVAPHIRAADNHRDRQCCHHQSQFIKQGAEARPSEGPGPSDTVEGRARLRLSAKAHVGLTQRTWVLTTP